MASDTGDSAFDRLMRRPARGGTVAQVLAIVGVVGSLLLAPALVGLLQEPWSLTPAAPTTPSVKGICAPRLGAILEIEVDGRRFHCRGAPSKCPPREPVPIAYDPQDPQRCRVAAHVDRLSPYERVVVTLAAMFFVCGLSGATYQASEHLRLAEIASDQPRPRRALLRRISGTALLLLPVLGLISSIAFTALWVGDP